jgi:hypothetical protein
MDILIRLSDTDKQVLFAFLERIKSSLAQPNNSNELQDEASELESDDFEDDFDGTPEEAAMRAIYDW